jgi:hypothetical protein
MSSTDRSYHFVIFSPIGAGGPSELSRRQAHMETLSQVNYIHVSVSSYRFRATPCPLTDRSFAFVFRVRIPPVRGAGSYSTGE